MTRYVAFLRAINVGGRNVKMARLRELFASFGYADVETFIASGNVFFVSPTEDARTLEKEIEGRLHDSLGYEVATFVRTIPELTEIANYQPFATPDLGAGGNSLYIALLSSPPTPEAEQRLMAYRSEIDDFHVHGREVYWSCRKTMSRSSFSGTLLEKTLGMPATMRNMTTIRKLASRCAASA